MNINGKKINTEEELIDLIKEGVNPLEYIENGADIEFISKAIAHEEQSQDPYWDDMAEILLKAIINYLIIKDQKDSSLKRCMKIVSLGTDKEKLNQLFNNLNDEATNYLYKAIEIVPDKTYNSIIEVLNKKLSKLVK